VYDKMHQFDLSFIIRVNLYKESNLNLFIKEKREENYKLPILILTTRLGAPKCDESDFTYIEVIFPIIIQCNHFLLSLFVDQLC
jgi:hypothetical protein